MYGKQLKYESNKKLNEFVDADIKTNKKIYINVTPIELNIIFVGDGNSTNIKIKADSMIAELLNEYYVKTNNVGTFTYKNSILSLTDCSALYEKGMKNGDKIIVIRK